MSTIATLTSNESGADSLIDINNNFANLNADKVEGPASSVDSEVALFSGTGGKTIKRLSGSGLVKSTSGVASVVAAPSGVVVGDSDTQTLTNKTLTTPTIGSFANANHNHENSAGGGTLDEDALALTDVTTNNVSTSKHGFAPKGDGDTSKFLNANGVYSAPSSGIPKMSFSTIFETAGRFNLTRATGTINPATFDTLGLNLATGGTADRSSVATLENINSTEAVFAGSPTFSCFVGVRGSPTTGSAYFGIGNVTCAGTGHTFTPRHAGFKIITSGSTNTLYATQANGTTETASSALTTLVFTDDIELIVQINSTTSVDYYWRKNGGSLSSATNLSTNMPTGGQGITMLTFSTSNDNTATGNTYAVMGASYSR